MRKSISRFFVHLAKLFGGEEVKEVVLPSSESQQEQEVRSNTEIEEKPLIIDPKKQEENQAKKKTNTRRKKPREGEIVTIDPRDIRDVMELMEVPFLALSKNRETPIIYESSDSSIKVKISGHPPHYVASIYDWDIVLYVASKMQEILNKAEDIPPRTLIFPRHELLKSIHKHNVNTQQRQLEASLHRLKRTAIDTTIRNEDYRYKADFGFIDSWDYTERRDIKEIRITLSQWLYDGICVQGALLKIDPKYFNLTSGQKKFLYRTARKHVGNSKETWEFSIERLYEKSGSERELRKFMKDLKSAILANDIPEYSLQLVQKNKRNFVVFKRSQIEQIEGLVEKNQ